jgi:plasmid stabilization system protein ParE
MKPVRTTPHADLQILEIDVWWTANRDKAPLLFVEELETAFELIARHPSAGKPRKHRGVLLGRVLLPKTKFHVYYEEQDDSVLVVAVWSGVRGWGPDLGKLPL